MNKIFELIHDNKEKEWIKAQTNVEALVHYVNQTECDLNDLTGCEIKELPKDIWKSYFIYDSENESFLGYQISFHKWMKNNTSQTPEIICGTIY